MAVNFVFSGGKDLSHSIFSSLLAFKINFVECKWKRLIYALPLSDMQRACASALCKHLEQQTILFSLLLLCYMSTANTLPVIKC